MNSMARVLRQFFASTARRLGDLRAPRDRGATTLGAPHSPVGQRANDVEEQTIDLLRDTLTSAPAPKLR